MARFISDLHFETWRSQLPVDIEKGFLTIQEQTLEPHSFTFYTSVSVMSSSKIEGEQLEVDSYVKHKLLNIEYLPELTEKPNDLFSAYLFAKSNPLTEVNFLETHKLLTAHLLPQSQRGALRHSEMLVMDHKTGRIHYEAAQASMVPQHFVQLWEEIDELLQRQLTTEEVFYYAAYIHLAFVKIHPFADGNGRGGRLLEKWFLASKLGERAWFIPSEQYYYQHVDSYYSNLARLGLLYDELDYSKSIPFLLMLPQALAVS